MANELARKTAIESMAARLQVSSTQLQKTLQMTAFKDCKTPEEFVACVIVANTYQLNPLLKEIYAFSGKGGGVVPIVPVDGWISLMNKHRNQAGEFDHDGITTVENKAKDGQKNASKTDVESITATIFTKGRTHPTVVTEYMEECFNGNKEPWKNFPRRMLRHKAIIQCARVAYGFSGIYDPDEGERIIESQIVGGQDPIVMPQPKIPEPVLAGPVVEMIPPGELSQEEKDDIQAAEAKAANEVLKAKKERIKSDADRALI